MIVRYAIYRFILKIGKWKKGLLALYFICLAIVFLELIVAIISGNEFTLCEFFNGANSWCHTPFLWMRIIFLFGSLIYMGDVMQKQSGKKNLRKRKISMRNHSHHSAIKYTACLLMFYLIGLFFYFVDDFFKAVPDFERIDRNLRFILFTAVFLFSIYLGNLVVEKLLKVKPFIIFSCLLVVVSLYTYALTRGLQF
jgi:hypothetical protein